MNHQQLPRCGALLAAVLLGACATKSGSDPAVAPGGTDGAQAGSAAESPDHPTPSTPAPDTVLPPNAGTEDLVGYALRHNAQLRALRAKASRLEARIPQERALPQPMARLSAGSMAETAAGRSDLMVGVEQRIPFPGKRASKASAAASEADAARADVLALELGIAEQVRSAHWDHFLAVTTESLMRESRDALTVVQDSVDARVRTNQEGQDSLLRISNEIGSIEQRLAVARQQAGSARARLNSLLDRDAGDPLPVANPTSPPSAGEMRRLLARAESSHPGVRAAAARVDAFRHRLEAARLERLPDISLGLTYGAIADEGLAMSANGRDQIFGTLGISLPIWAAPLDAARREAAAGIEETESALAATRSDLRFRVEDAWLRLATSRELIALLEDRLVPDARQAHDLALAGYAAGTRSFVDVLDTWRRHLELELMTAANRSQLGKADAALRSATDLP